MKLDKEELELLDLVDKTDEFERVDDYEQAMLEAKIMAKNYLNKTKNINIRLSEADILMLKRKSTESNIPYQTLVSSLIHQYATDKIQLHI
ncbi:conserved domain protein [uncultured Candidatus Thioglobus sp.]|nr:conserved domain protein [uncultured Candidatus Thioglobus sp.]